MTARLLLATALCAIALTGLTTTAQAAPPPNDRFESAALLDYGTTATASNADATIEPGESVTANGGPEHNACFFNNPAHDYTQADRTVWWYVIGTGRPVTVITAGSYPLDTVLGVFYSGVTETTYACDDARDSADGESLTFDTYPGAGYHIQVGTCVASTLTCGSRTGTIHLLAASPAAGNDNRAAAAPLATGGQVAGDNYAATEEPGENLACQSERGTSPYGRTVWYRWTATEKGTTVFTADGFDTVLAVYPGAATVPARCDDDPQRESPSRISLEVNAGDYFVQVAGYGAHRSEPGVDSVQGALSVRAEFIADPDDDDDGSPDSADCQRENPFVYPGSPDKPHDGKDTDCKPGDAKWPKLRADAHWSWAAAASNALRLTRLTTTRVRARARVEVRCHGRGCPFRRRTIRHAKRSRLNLLDRRLRRARLHRGVAVQVRVTSPGYVGRVETWRFGRAAVGSVERCVNPGTGKVIRCSRAG